MTEKYLIEADWKKFSKGRDYKDVALLKALSGLAKAESAGPDEQIEALDRIADEANALIKAHKSDKELADYLASVLAAARKQRKASEQAAATADEDDEPASALLDPAKLLQQLNLCKRNPERTVQFGFTDGKDKMPAVLALHPKISGRRLFAKLQAETGVKTGAYGSAWIDGSSLMLQLDKPLGGLVKKVRGPVKAAGFRIAKVVIWNADGSVFEQDQEEAEGAEEAPDRPTEPVATTTDPAPELLPRFQSRMAELEPQWLKALKEQQGDVSKLRALAEFAREKAGAGNYESALKALDALEKLLPADPPGNSLQQAYEARLAELEPLWLQALSEQRGDGSKIRAVADFAIQSAGANKYESALKALDALEKLLPAKTVTATTGGGESFSKVQFELVHLDWEARKKEVGALLAELHAAIVEEADDPETASAAKKLDRILARFNEGLSDTLDTLRNAADPAARSQLAAKAGAIADRYLAYLGSDPLVAHVEDNPYDIPAPVKDTLSAPLIAVKEQLARLAA